MKNNFTHLHLHTSISLLDSCTDYKEYIDKAKEYGMDSICFTEHGTIGLWVEKKMYCEKNNIKYIHGIEIYLTENLEPKVRDNYHTVLIAKNYDGVKEINSLIEVSSREDHKYYKDRISFDEFLKISENVIKISACLQSPLNKLNEDNPYYEKLAKHYDFYEIQPHKTSNKAQENYNLKLVSLAKKYNKMLVATTDVHYSNQYKGECRSILQLAKGIEYEDEDSFDLSFKSFDEMADAFKNQGVLSSDIYMEAIENTNYIAEIVENFELDLSPKYLKLYENDEQAYLQRIRKMFIDKVERGIIKQDSRYISQLKEEIQVLKKLNMMGFMLFMSELMSWCWENNIPSGPCRGSVGGSLVAFITDITDVDPIRWNTVFSRFANEDRVELGDIDVDFAPIDREAVYQYIISRVKEENSAYISTVGTVADKGTIDEIGRALSKKWMNNNQDDILTMLENELNELKSKKEYEAGDLYGIWEIEQSINKRYNEIKDSDNPYSLDIIANIKEEYDQNPTRTKEKYPDIFYYFDGIVGTAISKGIHPAGIVASNAPLSADYGVYWYDGKRVLSLNMEEVHEVSLIKYDILALNNIQIINETCKLANIPYPKSHELNWEDEDVWNDMVTDPTGIFQFSSDYAFDCLKKFSPHKINDMSLVNAALRPSGATYRDDLFAGKIRSNPSKLIDDLLKDNNGHLVFQEDTIKFLKDICGLSGSEADNIRRAIGRKQKDRLMKAMPGILEGYCSKSDSPREVAEEEAKQFLQIIEDSSDYQFGYNHSTGYSMIGYMCAYFRYHYPIEFVTAYLNCSDTMEDIKNGMNLAKNKNINIENIRYGYSIDKYTFNKETNTIYKGISSIKFCNSNIALQLKELSVKYKISNFYDLIEKISSETKVDSRQMKILIILDFFKDFGNNEYLLNIYEIYQNINGRLQFSKNSLSQLNIEEHIMRKYSSKETEKTFKDLDIKGLANELIKEIPNKSLNIKDQMEYEMKYLEYVVYKNEDILNNVYFVMDFKTYKNKFTPYILLYSVKDGTQIKTKVTKSSFFKEAPFKQFSILGDLVFRECYKTKFINGSYVKTDETEFVVDWYNVYKL